ncbi:MAG: DUF444 family protein, partial [Desulfobacteraceae bacterium]
MKTELWEIYQSLKARGLPPEQEAKILEEIHAAEQSLHPGRAIAEPPRLLTLYDFHDMMMLQDTGSPKGSYTSHVRSIDELLAKDKQRQEDGFPRKIRVGRMVKPGRGGTDKVVVVPTTVEDKLIHDPAFDPEDQDQSAGGSGQGEEGEVIGEQPVRETEQGGAGPGQGGDEQHELESSAYDLGKILTEQFELPNLKDKGKKRSLTRYTYDMTDRNRGFGQILDKKATL